AADLGLTPYRRHIFESGPLPGVRPDGPFVWDMDHDVYYRPAGDRLWLCACDEEPHPPGSPEPEPGAEAALREKLAAAFPALARVELPSARACLRTFAPDRRYVIGPDPALPGLFWVAGLGGSGATAGAAVGELAAERLLRGGGPVDAGAYPETAFDPVRFAGGAPTLEAES
ncbi:MAG TPA: FAD-dependent oxidoreductase, partial [Candidatus Polarisedimenticolia bacterium]|nr:FAD-dependent oxidoreductase [Candidatus Polarisedimenticolia bacterium]